MIRVLARPPEVHARCRSWSTDSVGLDQRAVDRDVAVPGHLRRQQRRFQARRLGRQDLESLIEIVVNGGFADRVIDSQLRHASVVEEPAQDQDRLLERGQRPAVFAGAAPHTLSLQQVRQVQHGLLVYRQCRGV
jgi:hypothetical protein